MGPTYAGILGALAFVLVILRGLISGSSATSVLPVALGGLFGFALIGYVAGRLAEQSVIESVKLRFEQELSLERQEVKQSPDA